MICQILLIVLSLSIVSCNEYMYVFAQEWPGSVCKHQNCQPEFIRNFKGNSFSIHGLWPDIDAQTSCKQINTCTHETYNPSSLSATTQQLLDESWVGLYSSVDWFREHEWSKHGTCWQGAGLTNAITKQESYFLTVHALWNNYNLFEGLASVGVHPSNTQLYPYSTVLGGIKAQAYKVSGGRNIADNMIQVQCQKDPSTGHQMIEQVYLCLNDDYMPMDCVCSGSALTLDATTTCGSSILFPTF